MPGPVRILTPSERSDAKRGMGRPDPLRWVVVALSAAWALALVPAEAARRVTKAAKPNQSKTDSRIPIAFNIPQIFI